MDSRASSAMDRQWYFSLPVSQGSSRAGEDDRQSLSTDLPIHTVSCTRYSYTYTNALSFSFRFFLSLSLSLSVSCSSILFEYIFTHSSGRLAWTLDGPCFRDATGAFPLPFVLNQTKFLDIHHIRSYRWLVSLKFAETSLKLSLVKTVRVQLAPEALIDCSSIICPYTGRTEEDSLREARARLTIEPWLTGLREFTNRISAPRTVIERNERRTTSVVSIRDFHMQRTRLKHGDGGFLTSLTISFRPARPHVNI